MSLDISWMSILLLPTLAHLCCWGFYIRRPRRQMLNVVTKDKNLFCCSIVNVKLGQKLSSEPKVETRYSSAPIAQMQC